MKNLILVSMGLLLATTAFAEVSVCTLSIVGTGPFKPSMYISKNNCSGPKKLGFERSDDLGETTVAVSRLTREAASDHWRLISISHAPGAFYLVFQNDGETP